MSLLLIGAGAAALFALISFIGPLLVRTAAPVLMRVPRLAVYGLLLVSLMWWAVVAALSLMAASLFKGPDVLPVPLAECASGASSQPVPSPGWRRSTHWSRSSSSSSSRLCSRWSPPSGSCNSGLVAGRRIRLQLSDCAGTRRSPISTGIH